MDDEMVQVKDSAAWTVGRVCERCPAALLNDQYLLPLLQALIRGLEGEPRVAVNACWVSQCSPTLHNLIGNVFALVRLSLLWLRQLMMLPVKRLKRRNLQRFA